MRVLAWDLKDDIAGWQVQSRLGKAVPVDPEGRFKPSMASLSAGAVAELETGFDDIERELRSMAGDQLQGREDRWGFQRRQGPIAEELLAAARDMHAAHPDTTVVIVVGSSSAVAHRVVGSVTVSLARHSPVPLVIVP